MVNDGRTTGISMRLRAAEEATWTIPTTPPQRWGTGGTVQLYLGSVLLGCVGESLFGKAMRL